MSWVRNPLAAPNISHPVHTAAQPCPAPPKPRPLRHRRLRASIAGTSGWAYPTWKPDFYPAGTPAKRFLEFYASQLSSVEVNYTFRALPTAKMLEGWLAATPADFRFSFKAPQRITHFKRLRDCDDDVAQFVAALEPVRQAGKLGLLLFQLPPNFKADAERLSGFLATPALRTKRTRRRSRSSSATSRGSPKRSTPSCASTMPRSASPRVTISLRRRSTPQRRIPASGSAAPAATRR